MILDVSGVAQSNVESFKPQAQDTVIARATYGARADACFEDLVKKAQAVGANVGAYLFYRENASRDAQLSAFVQRVPHLNCYPVLDLENNAQHDGTFSPALHNADGKWLAEQLAYRYQGCILYFSPAYFAALGSPAWMLDYDCMIAHYGVEPGKPDWPHTWLWHQYTGEARTSRYPGKIDVSVEHPALRGANIVQRARSQIALSSLAGKGGSVVRNYWRNGNPTWSEFQVDQLCESQQWCGLFALWCMQSAEHRWELSKGIRPALKGKAFPEPGDLVIFKSMWHHAIVVSLDGGVLTTIDGNQPGIVERTRTDLSDVYGYYGF